MEKSIINIVSESINTLKKLTLIIKNQIIYCIINITFNVCNIDDTYNV